MSKTERQPGYYWVRINDNDSIAKYIKLDNGVFAWFHAGVLVRYGSDPNDYFQEIGSRITPEMRFTEEDMKGILDVIMVDWDTSSDEIFDKWLKQKETE